MLLTFDGDVCGSDANGGGSATSCVPGSAIHQSYGDQANANVSWSHTGGAESMQWWDSGWIGTANQAYGFGFVITIIPTAAYKIQLNSFDLSPFTDTRSYTSLGVLAHIVGSPGFNTGGDTISTLTNTPVNLTSSAGFDISVVGTLGNIGIDNIDFDVVPDDAVPEPATFGLAALALGALVLKKRS
ncbi:MAG: PEP-CTERM sorting domain-containing protein [Bryobacteraceae bacterium]|nr:PEP-CTERM sorting domain-containing protein [Bryobacteraceae bacterium]